MSAASFEYRAVDAGGARRRGVERASSPAELTRHLAAQGLTPIEIREARGERRFRRSGVSTKEIAHFTYQLSVLIAARVPISDGIMSIAAQESNPRLRAMVSDIASRIEAGERVADALAHHREAFGEVYLETIRAAEQSGNMVKSLEHLADMLERRQEMNQQVRGALMYPACVTAVLIVGVLVLIGFVVPRFTAMFEERGVPMPALTRVLAGFGATIRGYWFAYAGGILGLVLGARRVWLHPEGRLLIDRLLHRVPALRRVLIGLAVARFARVFGLCLGSGLNLIEAIELSGRASGRPMLVGDAEHLVRHVRQGGRLGDALASCAYLPTFARRMLTAGEQSGELPRMSAIVARHYEREASGLAKAVSTVIEPVMVVAIAAIVLVVALAVFLPMWNMVSLFG